MSTAGVLRFGVVGDPVAHSLSPRIHTEFAAQFGLRIEYEKYAVSPADFPGFVTGFAGTGGRGLNVTVPHKLAAFEMMDECDDDATRAAAVNTVDIDPASGRLRGFNTDGWGMMTDLEQRYAQRLQGRQVLLLGAGGAAQGVLGPLLQAAPASLTIANRTLGKAQQLVEQFAAGATVTRMRALSFAALSDASTDLRPDLVINATSLGLEGASPPLPAHLLCNAFCYDMSYGPSAVFCAWAAQQGAGQSVDGLGMLIEQAARSFAIWHSLEPETAQVFSRLRQDIPQPGA